MPPGGAALEAIWTLAVGAALLTLLTLGRVYRLGGQEGWSRGAMAHPLMLGIAFGLLAFIPHPWRPEEGWTLPWILLFLIFGGDGALLLVRARSLDRARAWAMPTHPGLFRHRPLLLMTRLVLTNLAPAALVLSNTRALALVALTLGLLLDRFAFYGLALKRTTEAEVVRANATIAALTGSSRDSGPGVERPLH
jgi:hypothetical protein